MRPEFRAQIEELVGGKVYDWQAKIIDAIMAEYEFKCPSFCYAGPGHQSRHDCTEHHPHPIGGLHSDDMYVWVGSAHWEELPDLCPRCHGAGEVTWAGRTTPEKCHSCNGSGHRRKLHNAIHEGYNCDFCRIPSEVREAAER